MILRNQLTLTLIGAFWFYSTMVSAETITMRMEFQQMVAVAKAECGAEWQVVEEKPLPDFQYDALQWELDQASDEPLALEEGEIWPRSSVHYRDLAHWAVIGADIGRMLTLGQLSKEYDATGEMPKNAIPFAKGYQARRDFQDCLMLSPEEYSEILKARRIPDIGTRVCIPKMNVGIDVAIDHVLTEGVPLREAEFKKLVTDVMIACDLPI